MRSVNEMNLEEIVEQLKAKKIKLTTQRMEIIKFVSKMEKGHFEAKELFSVLSKKIPSLSIATLYSTLYLLVDLGVIYSFSDGQKTIFDFNPAPHGHFVCRICGKIEDIEIKKLDLEKIRGKREKIEIVIRGVCEDCLKRVKD
ncbi:MULTISPECIES: Fur family transcriptional regulator [Thermotoga]|jgi:Fur family peroxide stress response transcriptional regulator|uniref:Ferric uptake regulation protein n=1 Tax=Thermotoga neapolitana (strain ATCC 49049 / DSM 4359 / NBRC 107923 / NS-E) TaxID=309803 RepID=B9K871_THENN|nr:MULTISPECIES: Fur family transcriptional regulator [Thermotoga]ACM23154.1 Ferric uptake regulation protein [Thermotoga neapolitana DSM 4359]AJG41067.1 Fur family transcriptional regulator [Thermotoga sp. RQ7]MDK2785780.1 Fur family transcriptional regulator, peroxide stress response regulator [Thermotoga sp.]MDK2950126.1 Fur family transcriptional regulator, peroxide stress response regulator [Thermotoga sp.]